MKTAIRLSSAAALPLFLALSGCMAPVNESAAPGQDEAVGEAQQAVVTLCSSVGQAGCQWGSCVQDAAHPNCRGYTIATGVSTCGTQSSDLHNYVREIGSGGWTDIGTAVVFYSEKGIADIMSTTPITHSSCLMPGRFPAVTCSTATATGVTNHTVAAVMNPSYPTTLTVDCDRSGTYPSMSNLAHLAPAGAIIDVVQTGVIQGINLSGCFYTNNGEGLNGARPDYSPSQVNIESVTATGFNLQCTGDTQAASCTNGVMDGTETGVDCGGACAPCGGNGPLAPATSCAAIHASYPASSSGRYWIDPDGAGPIPSAQTYCEMNDGSVASPIQTSCALLHATYPALPSGSYWLDPDGAGPVAASQVTCNMTTGVTSQVFTASFAAKTFTVPVGVTALSIHAWGGGGGGGGKEGTGAQAAAALAAPGGAGAYAGLTNFLVTPGEALTLRIGGGGSGGAGDGAGVYPNINPMAGGAISGGDGMGWSGGGGGRSELLRGATRLLVAAGGGGGGGAGQLCFGTTSIDPSLVLAGYLNGAAGGAGGLVGVNGGTQFGAVGGRGATAAAGGAVGFYDPSEPAYTLSFNGTSLTGGDGPGAVGVCTGGTAGGGAGYFGGGAGGTHGYDYEGGTAGGGGSSFVVAGGTVISGSGATAANQADAYYASSIGRGGPASTAANTAGVNGGNGRIALVW
jgi:hypothetical protein